MTILAIIACIVAYLIVGVMVGHIGDRYFGSDSMDDGSIIGIAVMWPLIIVGAIVYILWKCIHALGKMLSSVLIQIFDNIIELNRNRDNLK